MKLLVLKLVGCLKSNKKTHKIYRYLTPDIIFPVAQGTRDSLLHIHEKKERIHVCHWHSKSLILTGACQKFLSSCRIHVNPMIAIGLGHGMLHKYSMKSRLERILVGFPNFHIFTPVVTALCTHHHTILYFALWIGRPHLHEKH